MARVEVEGPFGTLKTVAAVSKGLPEEYPYLFSNKSESLLNEQGKSFADVEAQVLALTRSKARQLSAQLRYADKEEEPDMDEPVCAESGGERVEIRERETAGGASLSTETAGFGPGLRVWATRARFLEDRRPGHVTTYGEAAFEASRGESTPGSGREKLRRSRLHLQRGLGHHS
ncbi:hypothetical protein HPB50_025141 [Hyalomma asiaticum]|uniref:Uncharacterized protein n=1 Tax=Hyalomma asiaticum TaxID=266040 RepID=A0ACB7S9W0_HYAAI|nr:hypothetical protein HPB50_025141 [Hyalomma asiaticum]